MARGDFDATQLGPDTAETFQADGIVCIRNLLEPRWIELLREAIDHAIANPGPGKKPGGQGYFVENCLWRHHEGFAAFAKQGPIARVAALLMRAHQVRMYNDTMFVKEPAAPEPTPWHHDLPYFNMAGRQNCSVWIPLDPVTQASGAMSFVRGSHRWGKMFQPVSFGQKGGERLSEDGFDGAIPDIEGNPAQYDIASFDMQPGDVTFHHLLTLHKAGANTTTGTRRRVHTIRMGGDDATYIDRPYSVAEFDTDLTTGEPLSGPLFPVLWPAPDVRPQPTRGDS